MAVRSWNQQEIPDWWLEKFPHTYMEFKPMRDCMDITVYFKMAGSNVRLDFEVPSESFKDSDDMFRHVAMQMLDEFITLGDLSTDPLLGYGHLIWDDKWRPEVDKPGTL